MGLSVETKRKQVNWYLKQNQRAWCQFVSPLVSLIETWPEDIEDSRVYRALCIGRSKGNVDNTHGTRANTFFFFPECNKAHDSYQCHIEEIYILRG